jgi:sarcosine oxidase, subunit gamma
MAEPARTSPFTRLPAAGAAASADALTIAECRDRAVLTVAGPATSAGFVAAVRAAIGAELPREPGTVAAARAGWTLWTGPGEWLYVAPGGDGWALERELLRATAPVGGKVVDVSHGRAILRVAGARTRDLLAKFCPIDLAPATFPPGSCAQTLFGKINILLHAPADGAAIELYVSRSYADAFADALLAGAREYGGLVVPPRVD